MTASFVAGSGVNGSYSTLTGPTLTFTGYTPVADDFIVVLVQSQSTSSALPAPPSGWLHHPSGLRSASDSTMCAIMVFHVVTAAEETAGTNSWSLAGLFPGNETGNYSAAIYRGVDPAAPIDAYALGFNEDEVAGTTSLVGLTGADLLSDSLVVSGICADSPVRVFTTPSGFTQDASGVGVWLGHRDTPTSAGVAVPNTTIAMDVLDETISYSVAIKAAAGGGGGTPPTADAGADQDDLEPFSVATLSGSGTDADGPITAYAWTQIDGPPVTLINDDTDECTYVVPALIDGGTATFRLTVTDGDDDTGTDDVIHTWLPHTWFIVSDPLTPIRASLIG